MPPMLRSTTNFAPMAANPSRSDRLSLMAIHAHPDDEASKGAGTVARYSHEGVHTVLVTCTGGEAGDILNPAVDTDEVRERLADVRMEELLRAVEIIGYDVLHLLGYHDSGMPDTEHNQRNDNFANADNDEVVGKLVELIRLEKPQVILTYDDSRFYPHPDHLKVHEVSVPAFDAAGDPDAYPDAGEPWQPAKLYYTGFSKRRVMAMHEAFERLGVDSPFKERIVDISELHDDFTTLIDIRDHIDVRRDALLAHATQIDPESHWMSLSEEVMREVIPWEEFVPARSLVDTGATDENPETDLFAGVRETVEAET